MTDRGFVQSPSCSEIASPLQMSSVGSFQDGCVLFTESSKRACVPLRVIKDMKSAKQLLPSCLKMTSEIEFGYWPPCRQVTNVVAGFFPSNQSQPLLIFDRTTGETSELFKLNCIWGIAQRLLKQIMDFLSHVKAALHFHGRCENLQHFLTVDLAALSMALSLFVISWDRGK